MKKLLISLSLLLLLVSCTTSTASISLSDGESEIVTIGEQTINKDAIFNMMKSQDLGSTVVEIAKVTLVNSIIEVDETIEKRAQELLESNKEYFGESFESIVKNYYGSEEEFLETQLIPSAQQEALAKIYFEDNFDKIIAENKPRQVIIVTTESQDDAQSIIDAMENDEDLPALLEELKIDESYGEPVIIANTSSVPTDVLEFIQEGSIDDVTSEAILDEKTYYAIKILETDAETLREDFFTIFVSVSTNLDTMYQDYFKKHKFNVYDQQIYDAIKNDETLEGYNPNN